MPTKVASKPLFQFAEYMSTAPGIENILRLLQAVSQLLAVWHTSGISEAGKWRIAGKQFALGRRYFRYFQFLTYFQNAWETINGHNEVVARRGRIAVSIEVCFLSTYGCYLLLEACTILDALGVHSSEWSRMMLLEANKLWFYALVFSIVGNIWQFFLCIQLVSNKSQSKASATRSESAPSSPGSKSQGRNRSPINRNATEKVPRQVHETDYLPYSSLLRNLVVNGCDLLIPASLVGWIEVSPLLVNSAMVLSTVLVGNDRWMKSQGKT